MENFNRIINRQNFSKTLTALSIVLPFVAVGVHASLPGLSKSKNTPGLSAVVGPSAQSNGPILSQVNNTNITAPNQNSNPTPSKQGLTISSEEWDKVKTELRIASNKANGLDNSIDTLKFQVSSLSHQFGDFISQFQALNQKASSVSPSFNWLTFLIEQAYDKPVNLDASICTDAGVSPSGDHLYKLTLDWSQYDSVDVQYNAPHPLVTPDKLYKSLSSDKTFDSYLSAFGNDDLSSLIRAAVRSVCPETMPYDSQITDEQKATMLNDIKTYLEEKTPLFGYEETSLVQRKFLILDEDGPVFDAFNDHITYIGNEFKLIQFSVSKEFSADFANILGGKTQAGKPIEFNWKTLKLTDGNDYEINPGKIYTELSDFIKNYCGANKSSFQTGSDYTIGSLSFKPNTQQELIAELYKLFVSNQDKRHIISFIDSNNLTVEDYIDNYAHVSKLLDNNHSDLILGEFARVMFTNDVWPSQKKD